MLSFVLRHGPSTIGVELDRDGWTDLAAVVHGLRERPAWTDVSEEEVHSLLTGHAFTRFEIEGPRIRALYGHSVRHVSPGSYENPPELLFHTTQTIYFNAIRSEGIAARSRSHAHLTSSLEYALTIKEDHERSGRAAVILGIQTEIALKGAIPFYRASEVVWTAPYIFPSALMLVTTNRRRVDRIIPLETASECPLFLGGAVASFNDLLRDCDASD